MLERENIAKEVDMDCRGVVEVIAKEVDDEKAKGNSSSKAANSSRSKGSVDRPVDRPHKQEIGRPAWSTDVHNVHKEISRSTARSTD